MNLGTLTAMRGDLDGAQRLFARGAELGFSATGARRLFRKVAGNVNVAVGAAFKRTVD